jgi:DNA polymerase-3 subunit gamma/tau
MRILDWSRHGAIGPFVHRYMPAGTCAKAHARIALEKSPDLKYVTSIQRSVESEMSYIVSARKYRPQTFEDLIGQGHIASTLRNAIARDRVGHAYLFSGPRGVGKTSAARIFAKALNCEKGPTGTPCGVCTFCREITEGRALDLVEIDGASNRRIDEVRQIRENVRFVPSSSRFKIYIIDEVHMLTTEAFNALLKTLEEPPEHVIFIFATTELQKVPQTIRSRCQQFVFKRIPIPLIVQMLMRIIGDLRVEADERALFWIARCASGSMRDAESILDQMISYSEGPINTEDVFYVLGLPGYDIYHRFAEFIAEGDFNASYRLLDELMRGGMEISVLVSGLLEYYRNLFVLSVDEGAHELIDLPGEDVEEMRKFLGSYGPEDVHNILILLSRLYMDTRSSEIDRQLLEVALIKLVRYRDIVHPASLLQRLEELKGEIDRSGPGTGKPSLSGNTAQGVSSKPGETGKGSVESGKDSSSELPEQGGQARQGTSATSKGEQGQADLSERIIRHFSHRRRALAEFLKRAKFYTLEDNLLTITYDGSEKYSYDHVHESSAKRYLEKEIRTFLQKDIRLNVAIERDKKQSGKEHSYSEDISKVMKIFKGEIVPNSTKSIRGGK